MWVLDLETSRCRPYTIPITRNAERPIPVSSPTQAPRGVDQTPAGGGPARRRLAVSPGHVSQIDGAAAFFGCRPPGLTAHEAGLGACVHTSRIDCSALEAPSRYQVALGPWLLDLGHLQGWARSGTKRKVSTRGQGANTHKNGRETEGHEILCLGTRRMASVVPHPA